MAEARERSEWNRAASLLVKLHNVNITKPADAIKFEDVHPYFIMQDLDKVKQQAEPSPEQLAMLEGALKGM